MCLAIYRFLPLNFRLFHSCLLFICVCLDDTYMLIEWSRSTQLCQFLDYPVDVCLWLFTLVSIHLCVWMCLSVQEQERQQRERNRRVMAKVLNSMTSITYRTTWNEVTTHSYPPLHLSLLVHTCASLRTFSAPSRHIHKLMCICLHIRKLSFCHNMRNWSLSIHNARALYCTIVHSKFLNPNLCKFWLQMWTLLFSPLGPKNDPW